MKGVSNKMKAKKLLSIMLTAALSASICVFSQISAAAVSGTGTASDPYLVSNEDEFKLICDFPSSHFKLTQNIVLTDDFNTVNQFSGTIDGDGYIVVGLNSGELIYTNEGTIKNLIVEVKEITSAFIRINSGTIENTGIIDGTVTTRTGNAGTFVMTNDGIIKNCFSTTQLTVAGMYSSASVGGFVGANNGKIENCLYTGHIYCQGTTANGGKLYQYVSPFVGDNKEASSQYLNDGGTVTNCFYDKDNTDQVGKSSGGALGKSPAALTMQATYTDWDFTDTWAIDSEQNDGYPYLQCDRRFSKSIATPEPTASQTPQPSTENAKISISSSSAANGNTASVTVKIDGCDGFTNLGIAVSYDKNVMTLESAVNNAAVGGTFVASETVDTYPYVMTWNNTSNIKFNGNLAELTFKIKDNAPDGNYAVNVGYYTGPNSDWTDGTSVNYDENGNSLGLTYSGGAIRVSDFIPYDINGDGKVDNRDGTALLRYLAGWSDVEVVSEALDANGDGNMDNRDGTYLLRYLAGWNQ